MKKSDPPDIFKFILKPKVILFKYLLSLFVEDSQKIIGRMLQ